MFSPYTLKQVCTIWLYTAHEILIFSCLLQDHNDLTVERLVPSLALFLLGCKSTPHHPQYYRFKTPLWTASPPTIVLLLHFIISQTLVLLLQNACGLIPLPSFVLLLITSILLGLWSIKINCKQVYNYWLTSIIHRRAEDHQYFV